MLIAPAHVPQLQLGTVAVVFDLSRVMVEDCGLVLLDELVGGIRKDQVGLAYTCISHNDYIHNSSLIFISGF